jgi:ATP-binding cassette subfamily F protein uup
LQEVIGDYDGTVLIVSHDRDFLDRTVTITLGLDGSGTVDVVAGGYEDWEKRRASTTTGKRASKKVAATAPPVPAPRAKLTYKDQRDYELLPKRIEALDAQIAADATRLAAPDLYMRDHATFTRLTAAIEAARAEKEAAELRWLTLAEQAEG